MAVVQRAQHVLELDSTFAVMHAGTVYNGFHSNSIIQAGQASMVEREASGEKRYMCRASRHH